MKFRVIIEPDEDGVFVAECPTLPGCISQGASREEALTNIKDAIAGYLASLRKHDELKAELASRLKRLTNGTDPGMSFDEVFGCPADPDSKG